MSVPSRVTDRVDAFEVLNLGFLHLLPHLGRHDRTYLRSRLNSAETVLNYIFTSNFILQASASFSHQDAYQMSWPPSTKYSPPV